MLCPRPGRAGLRPMSTEGAEERLAIGLGIAAPLIGALTAATGVLSMDAVAEQVADRDRCSAAWPTTRSSSSPTPRRPTGTPPRGRPSRPLATPETAGTGADRPRLQPPPPDPTARRPLSAGPPRRPHVRTRHPDPAAPAAAHRRGNPAPDREKKAQRLFPHGKLPVLPAGLQGQDPAVQQRLPDRRADPEVSGTS